MSTADSPDGSVGGTGRNQRVAFPFIALVRGSDGFGKRWVVPNPPIHRLDSAGGFQSPDSRLGGRTGQPVPGWERRPIVEDRRNGHDNRKTQWAACDDVTRCPEGPPELCCNDRVVIHR